MTITTYQVEYISFLERFTLANPRLAPLFGLRDYFLALLARLDTSGVGAVPVHAFNTACAVPRQMLQRGANHGHSSIKHGCSPIKQGRSPIKRGHFQAKHGRFAIEH